MQMAQSDGLFSVFKRLIRFRTSNSTIALGELHDVASFDQEQVVSWQRTYRGESLLVTVNFGYRNSPQISIHQPIKRQI